MRSTLDDRVLPCLNKLKFSDLRAHIESKERLGVRRCPIMTEG